MSDSKNLPPKLPISELTRWSRLLRRTFKFLVVVFFVGFGSSATINLLFAQQPSADDALRGGAAGLTGIAARALVVHYLFGRKTKG